VKYFRLVAKDVSLQNVQTGSEVQQAPYPLSSGVTSREQNDPGVKLTTHLRLAAKLKTIWLYLCSFCTPSLRAQEIFTLLLLINVILTKDLN
jgi:hypothetical protein